MNQNSGVVYSIPCSGCPGSYVGETRQPLKRRLSQHKNDIKNRKDHTALSRHALDSGHNFNFDEAKIVGREDNDKKRKILEVVNIIKNKKSVNFKTDTDGFAKVYSSIFHDSLERN